MCPPWALVWKTRGRDSQGQWGQLLPMAFTWKETAQDHNPSHYTAITTLSSVGPLGAGGGQFAAGKEQVHLSVRSTQLAITATCAGSLSRGQRPSRHGDKLRFLYCGWPLHLRAIISLLPTREHLLGISM